MVVIHRSVFAVLGILVFVGCSEREPEVEAAGEEKSGKTAALEMGAALLQGQAPLNAMDVYLVGFHPLKNEPSHQMEAHHFCHQVNEDFAQCALFDGNTENANLNGIEYIISERLFETLPEEEKPYWHPHNYEILSGQLTAPGIPSVAEMELMESKMNSYGKTWHVWNTSRQQAAKQQGEASGQRGADNLPLGDAKLAWSFNRDGQIKPGLVEARDQRMGIDSDQLREQRKPLADLAKPQMGESAIEDALNASKDRP